MCTILIQIQLDKSYVYYPVCQNNIMTYLKNDDAFGYLDSDAKLRI